MSKERVEKVNSLLEHEVSKIIQREINFPDNVLVTLTHVDCSTNLIEAKVYISVYPETEFNKIMRILKSCVYDVQWKINRTLRTRPVPKIIFVKDENASKAGKIEELLAELKNEGK